MVCWFKNSQRIPPQRPWPTVLQMFFGLCPSFIWKAFEVSIKNSRVEFSWFSAQRQTTSSASSQLFHVCRCLWDLFQVFKEVFFWITNEVSKISSTWSDRVEAESGDKSQWEAIWFRIAGCSSLPIRGGTFLFSALSLWSALGTPKF